MVYTHIYATKDFSELFKLIIRVATNNAMI